MHLDLAGNRPLHEPDLPIRDRADSGRGLVIDASRLEFASPLDLAATAALAHVHAAAGEPADLVLPKDPNIASYLRRMDLLDHVPPGTRVLGPLAPEERMDRTAKLLEVTLLTPGNAGEISERIGRLATGNLGPPFGRRTFKAVGELIDNATTHGQGSPGAYICAQAYTGQTTAHPGLQVAVCDTGMGVLAHLSGNPRHAALAEDIHALQCAVKPGVTGTTDERGNGLPDLLAASSPVGDTRLLLRSGDGLLTVQHGPVASSTVGAVSGAARVKGTWAWLDMRFPL